MQHLDPTSEKEQQVSDFELARQAVVLVAKFSMGVVTQRAISE